MASPPDTDTVDQGLSKTPSRRRILFAVIGAPVLVTVAPPLILIAVIYASGFPVERNPDAGLAIGSSAVISVRNLIAYIVCVGAAFFIKMKFRRGFKYWIFLGFIFGICVAVLNTTLPIYVLVKSMFLSDAPFYLSGTLLGVLLGMLYYPLWGVSTFCLVWLFLRSRDSDREPDARFTLR